MTTTAPQSKPTGTRVRVQRFGTFLSGMVMPNIPAFIAWGLITALFIPTGWAPNGILGGFGNADLVGWTGAATATGVAEDGSTFPQYVGLVGPMITYLLPLLIANTGGRMVYNTRGGVIATIATMGVIVGSQIPMFIGAMIVGPLAAWLLMKVDSIWDGKVKPGFEMLIDNFSAGIHEIYFPYVLMKPILILAAIGGGMTGVAVNVAFQTGLRAPASPGSIFAVLFQTAPDSYFGVILSVVAAASMSFLIAAVILRASRERDIAAGETGDLGVAVAQTEAYKGKSSAVLGGLAGASAGAASADAAHTASAHTASAHTDAPTRELRNIVFACDAGMGSSAMGASVLRNKIKKAGVSGVTVVNQAIANLDGTADLVITHQDLTDRARAASPNSMHLSVENFMSSPRYDEVVGMLVHHDQNTGRDEVTK